MPQPSSPTKIDRAAVRALLRSVPWHHDFEIVPGVRTSGGYDPSALWNWLGLPADLRGWSLADVGASNGYFSFEARQRGARVVAFDYRHKDNSGFGLAQQTNDLTDIEHHQINVLDLTPERFGSFDIVLALGLLYHTSAPLLALARCAALSRERLFVESYCIDAALPPERRGEPIMRFIPDCARFPERGNLNDDRSNFWGPTSTCVVQMVEDVGFEIERTAVAADRVTIAACRALADHQTRASLSHGVMHHVPRRDDPDDPGSWTIF